MKFSLINIHLCLSLITICFSARSTQEIPKKTLLLSEKEVLKKVLASSPFIEKVKLTKQKNLSQLLEKKYSLSSWGAFSNFTQSKRKNPEILVFEGKERDFKSFSVGLEKKIPYGLSLRSSYSNWIEKQVHSSDFLKFVKIPEQIYRKNLNLELNANLTSALTQHWTLKVIDEGQKVNQWLYYERAEELALKAVGQYWKTYLAWITYTQTKEGLKTYRQLVRQINNKKKYGFLNPGERPQILAEYENIQISIDKQKQNYENEKKTLLLFLKKNPHFYDIQFTEPKLFPLPVFSKINIENTRIVKIKEKYITEQKLKLKASKIRLFPNLQLLGKGGFIPGASSPRDLSFSSKQSFYELGLGLTWGFFSKSLYEKVNFEKYNLEENKIDFEISKQELKNKLSSLEKEILINYKNVKRAEKSNNYQKRAFKELQRSFEQGRVDIFELINTEKKLRESEVKKKVALSKYFFSHLQILAFRDQLVEDYLKP